MPHMIGVKIYFNLIAIECWYPLSKFITLNIELKGWFLWN